MLAAIEPDQLLTETISSHVRQVCARLASIRDLRAAILEASSFFGILLPVPKYISSGVSTGLKNRVNALSADGIGNPTTTGGIGILVNGSSNLTGFVSQDVESQNDFDGSVDIKVSP